MDDIDRVAARVGQLRVGDAQVAQLLDGRISVHLRVCLGADTADVAHFMKDGTHLRRQEQKD